MARQSATLRMHLMAILWPSFLMAGVLEMLVFALVDPAGLRWMGGSFWVPGRKSSHWMRCPSCGKRTWCAVGWQD